MLKAVIDTSVLISGLIKSSDCRKIIIALEDSKFIPVISPDILEEFIDVISRPKFKDVIHRETAMRLAEVLKVQSLFVKPTTAVKIVIDDPDDNKFLEAALTARADCVVSLDNHLLKLNVFRFLPILTPKEFLTLLLSKSR